jgi:hypothetical protein
VFVGDRDRERAAVTLREHYVRGRLTLDELSDRTGRVLAARSQQDLWNALSGLPRGVLSSVPVFVDAGELVAQGRSAAQGALRVAGLVVLTGVYLLFSFALMIVLGLTLLIHGASAAVLIGFLVVWLVPTYVLGRLWHRKPGHRRPGT